MVFQSISLTTDIMRLNDSSSIIIIILDKISLYAHNLASCKYLSSYVLLINNNNIN